MILGCIKLTVKTNQHIYSGEGLLLLENTDIFPGLPLWPLEPPTLSRWAESHLTQPPKAGHLTWSR